MDAQLLENTAAGLLTALEEASCGMAAHVPEPEPGRDYHRVVLRRDDQLEMTAARWRKGGESVLHGHGKSTAVYLVHSGAIQEERFVPEGDGFRYETAVLEAGDWLQLPPGAFHRIRALEESATLHGYAPAPSDPVVRVPEHLIPQLEAARRQATTRGNLADVVRSHLNRWAAREEKANRDRQCSLPPITLAEFRASGILSGPVAAELDGWNATLPETVDAIRQIACRAPATALALAMPLGNAATTRIPEDMVPAGLRHHLAAGQRWIAEQARRGYILAVANSEPGAGGELAKTRTTAERGEDGVMRLTGSKSFATIGGDADFFLCAARRDDFTRHGRPVVDGFFVARTAPGLILQNDWNPAGMRPTASVGLTLQRAPAAALLGYPGCLEGINARHWSTLLFAAVFLGIGEGALQQGVAGAGAEATWSRATLAECALNLDAAAGYLEAVAAAADGWPLPAAVQERTRRAKTFVARTAVETATRVSMIAGGRCYTLHHPVFRYLCDALAGPLLRPPLPQAMDSIVKELFPPAAKVHQAAA